MRYEVDSRAFRAFVGSLMFWVLFMKDCEIKRGVERRSKMKPSPQSQLLFESDELRIASTKIAYHETTLASGRQNRRFVEMLPMRVKKRSTNDRQGIVPVENNPAIAAQQQVCRSPITDSGT